MSLKGTGAAPTGGGGSSSRAAVIASRANSARDGAFLFFETTVSGNTSVTNG